ncbi:DEAD-box ATP-dependent RNA helicase 3, chloroplastic [Dorcoceras hygrometricum]|uniref:DEAD-box ATP-dependent RNA helicase 3, chloroplastic n=1 Tax=Dorcoceras hygrometricum TaxID=472368 RepID=A0A2Z7B507_9LAMI|nr:DEAD-box ATP-dependent RNA helicase 3, chloroplastic [Dorcoceras hygrometricum]
MSLFVKKFGKYLIKSYNPSFSYNNYNKSDKVSTDQNCFNCGRPGNFAADCNRPNKEDRPRRDEKNDDRTKERSKDRSKDRRMRTRSDRRPNRNNDRKVLVSEESNKNWADTDSDSTSSSSSSSDSEQEEVHCLMADQTSDDEVFDFSNIEFTREDLVSALNDMVKEYRNLTHTFEEVKAENANLKNSSVEPRNVELGEADSLQIELNKPMAENELLRNESSELRAENERLNEVMRSWTKSLESLNKLQESQRPVNDKSGLGFNVCESISGETSTQSQLAYDKFKKMSFVKASVIHDPYPRAQSLVGKRTDLTRKRRKLDPSHLFRTNKDVALGR